MPNADRTSQVGAAHESATPMAIRIPSEFARLADVREFVRHAGSRAGVAGEALDDLVQAVDECVTNVIRHGDRTPDGLIDIDLARRGQAVRIHVRDGSRAFDPTTVPEHGQPKSIEDGVRGGLGIPLMRRAVDEVHHRPLDGRGNELTLIKWLASETSEGGDDGHHD